MTIKVRKFVCLKFNSNTLCLGRKFMLFILSKFFVSLSFQSLIIIIGYLFNFKCRHLYECKMLGKQSHRVSNGTKTYYYFLLHVVRCSYIPLFYWFFSLKIENWPFQSMFCIRRWWTGHKRSAFKESLFSFHWELFIGHYWFCF